VLPVAICPPKKKRRLDRKIFTGPLYDVCSFSLTFEILSKKSLHQMLRIALCCILTLVLMHTIQCVTGSVSGWNAIK